MSLNYKFFIGIFLVLLGLLYGLWNVKKEDNRDPNIFTKVDFVNSWGIVICLIFIGIIMIIKYV